MFNVVKRADEDDVINVSMNGLAPSTGEIKEEKSCCLTNIAAVTLTHAKTGSAIILVTTTTAKVFAHLIAVFKLIIPSRHIKRRMKITLIHQITQILF